jgi:hypothetical protein
LQIKTQHAKNLSFKTKKQLETPRTSQWRCEANEPSFSLNFFGLFPTFLDFIRLNLQMQQTLNQKSSLKHKEQNLSKKRQQLVRDARSRSETGRADISIRMKNAGAF